jgi:rubrerythrin
MTSPATGKILDALSENWQAEMRGFHTYNAFAERDTDPIRKRILHNLAEAEARHAALWAGRIRELGGSVPHYAGNAAGDADKLASRVGGPGMALRRLEIDESRDIARYGEQLKALGDQPSIVILQRVIQEEQEHYHQLGSLIRDHYPASAIAEVTADPKAVIAEMLAKRSGSGKQAVAWIGHAIYGVNDGLGAIFGIVSGVSGATLGNAHYVLLAGTPHAHTHRWHSA